MALENHHTRRPDGEPFAYAFASRVEFRVAKKSARVFGQQILFHSQPHEAIAGVAEGRIREVPVMRQKGNFA